MKTARTLALLMGLITTFVIVSCHKNDLTANADEANARTAPAGIIENSLPLSELPDCNDHCINPGGPYVELTGEVIHTNGNPTDPQHEKTVSYVTYNTATSFIVEVTFVHNAGRSSNLVSVTALGSTQSVATLASGATATFTFDLPSGWSKCTNVPFAIHQEGQAAPINTSASYNLYGVCASKEGGCETSFAGEAISCGTSREAVFTFKSKDAHDYIKIQGGLTNFTGADATVYINGTVVDFNTTSADGWVQGTVNGYTVGQRTQGGSLNRNIRVEGGLTECDELVIRIVWTSTNAGGVITGTWSVKDANGVELVPAVAGLTCQ